MNGLSPGRPQAIIWTNVGILLIVPLGTNFGHNMTFIELSVPKKVGLQGNRNTVTFRNYNHIDDNIT